MQLIIIILSFSRSTNYDFSNSYKMAKVTDKKDYNINSKRNNYEMRKRGRENVTEWLCSSGWYYTKLTVTPTSF